MAYEKGSYLKELKAEHRNGQHEDHIHAQCSDCLAIEALKNDDPEPTPEEEMAFADRLQAEFDEAAEEHEKGWHTFDETRPYLFKPNPMCETCLGVKPSNYWR